MRTLQSELIRNGLLQDFTSVINQKNTKARDIHEERLTDRDWRELMGENRQTYKRVNGAVRRR